MEKQRNIMDFNLSHEDTTIYYSFDDSSFTCDEPKAPKKVFQTNLTSKLYGFLATSTPSLPTSGRSFAKRVLRDNLSITNVTSDFSQIILMKNESSKATNKSTTSLPLRKYSFKKETSALIADKKQQSFILKLEPTMVVRNKIASPQTFKEQVLLLDQMLVLKTPKNKFKPSKRNIRL